LIWDRYRSKATLDKSSVSADGSVTASATVKNVGKRAGDEVVQLYLKPLDPKRDRALRALRGIQRVALKPGESRVVTFTIEPDRDLTIYDEARKSYAVDPGRFEVEFAASICMNIPSTNG